MSVAEPDYAYETRNSVEARIDELSARAREALSEAEHARHQPGLLGPALSAEAAAKDLEAEIASLREVAFRVAAGYPYWEPHGLEIALDACGDPWNWQPLAEVTDGSPSCTWMACRGRGSASTSASATSR